MPLHTDRRHALIALVGLCGTPLARAQAGFTLVQLMQTLAQVKAGEGTFVEQRTVQMLERTLVSSGRIAFEAPDTFVRETIKPRRESVKVVGNSVTMSQGNRSRTVALDAAPEAALIFEAIRGTLTGNREALEKHFKPTVTGTTERWSLELVPREVLLRELVVSIRMSGVRALVREVLVVMADGDRSVMTIEPVITSSAAPASVNR
ncbi:MAG: LolA-related protein [Burkholderiales bacterium]|nr:LolA-related protein [Burkholderiales bacterium]